jgi:uroporphyrin-3 C-methyltransferase
VWYKDAFAGNDARSMTKQAPEQQDDVASPESPPENAAGVDAGVSTADSSDDSPPPVRADAPRRPPIASFLALALAIFAAAASGFLWWQYRQFYVVLDRADGEADVALREVRADLRGLEDRLAAAGQDRASLARELQQLIDRVDIFPSRFADLDEKLALAQGVSSDGRGRMLRAQAEYYLNVANAELTLSRDRNGAITALELADRALLDAGSPQFGPVREQIAGELQALRAVRAPDVEGLSYSLSRLALRVPELPMRLPAPETGAAATAVDDAEPGLARLWQSFKTALAGMFRIERRDAVPVYSLSRGQQALVRRQVELELTLSRLGLVEAMPELYLASIDSAVALLETHFDVEQAAVEGAIALLRDMRNLDVAPRYPDISGSLASLRSLPDRDG